MRSVLSALGLCIPAAAATAQPDNRAVLRAKFQGELRTIAEQFNGVAGIRVVDLTDSSTVGVNDNLVFPTGSTIKTAILLELLRQSEQKPGLLKQRREIKKAMQVGGTGVSQFFTESSSLLSLEDLAVLMINLSDNTATNILIDEVGMDAVNKTRSEER